MSKKITTFAGEKVQYHETCTYSFGRRVSMDGRIGEYCIFARQERGSDDWYIGGVNGDEAREVTIPMDMLDVKQTYQATLYLDVEQANWQTNPYDYKIEERALCAQDTLRVRMTSGGGLAIQINAQKAQ